MPEYPADKFEASLGKWRDLVASGKRTPGAIIATVCSSYRMTAEQARIVNALADAVVESSDKPAKDDEWLSDFDNGGAE